MKKTIFLLTVIFCGISSVFLLAVFSENKTSPDDVYEVLSSKGFKDETPLFCQIKTGGVTKNINQDVPILFKVIKKAVVTESSPEPSAYVIYLENGSSLESQRIVISISKTGNGYVEYIGKKLVFFKSLELYDFCVAAFNKSEIIIS